MGRVVGGGGGDVDKQCLSAGPELLLWRPVPSKRKRNFREDILREKGKKQRPNIMSVAPFPVTPEHVPIPLFTNYSLPEMRFLSYSFSSSSISP